MCNFSCILCQNNFSYQNILFFLLKGPIRFFQHMPAQRCLTAPIPIHWFNGLPSTRKKKVLWFSCKFPDHPILHSTIIAQHHIDRILYIEFFKSFSHLCHTIGIEIFLKIVASKRQKRVSLRSSSQKASSPAGIKSFFPPLLSLFFRTDFNS